MRWKEGNIMFAEEASNPEQDSSVSKSHSLENPKGLDSLPPIPIVRPPERKTSLPNPGLAEVLLTINLRATEFSGLEEIRASSIDSLSNTFSANIDLFKNALDNPHSYSSTLETVNNTLVYANRLFYDKTINLPEAERKKLVNLSDTVVSFMEQNIDKVELGMQNASLDGKMNAVSAVSNSLEKFSLSLSDKQQYAFFSFLLKHFESVLKQTEMANGLSHIGSINILRSALAQISRYQFVYYRDKNLDEMLMRMVNGLSANTINEWRTSTDREDMHHAITRNFMSVFELESQRPGIASALNKEFGISCFGRYPKNLLIAQYDNKDKKEEPYGVIINAKEDYNGAFYGNVNTYNKLFAQLQNRQKIRVFEVESPLDIVRVLNQGRHKYGKISFAIIGGHGTEKSVWFGRDFSSRKPSLRQEDLKRKGASALTLAFVENPTIILNSCSTGALGGIGEDMSNLGATIIAPPTPAAIKDIDVSIDHQGRPQFNVEYFRPEKGDSVPPNIYQKGVLNT